MARRRKVNYWSSADVRALKHKAGKMPIGQIAHLLGRTESAARQKAYSMGISTDSR